MPSALFYNGVALQLVETVEYSKRPILDALNNYLATRVIIRVKAIFNPTLNSYVKTAAGKLVQIQTLTVSVPTLPGNPSISASLPLQAVGPATEQAVRHALSQSRGLLIYMLGDTVSLVSPPIAIPGLQLVNQRTAEGHRRDGLAEWLCVLRHRADRFRQCRPPYPSPRPL